MFKIYKLKKKKTNFPAFYWHLKFNKKLSKKIELKFKYFLINQMQENDNFLCSSDAKRYKICPKMEIPTTKYLADYLYVVHEDVPFRYYRKVSYFAIFRHYVTHSNLM